MANAKRRHEWDQTSSMMALTANCNRDRKVRSTPFHPREFHPMAPIGMPKQVHDRLEGKSEFRVLKKIFVDSKKF